MDVYGACHRKNLERRIIYSFFFIRALSLRVVFSSSAVELVNEMEIDR
jgi:hypothetical protein